MKRNMIAGWTLIILGAVIILHNYGWFEFSRGFFIVFGSLALGILLFIKGLTHPRKKGTLLGSLLFFAGIILFLMKYGFLPINDQLGIAGLFFCLGIANLIYFAVSRQSVQNITFGIIYLLIALPFIISYYYFYPPWRLKDLFETYWPVLLIILGLGVMAEGAFKKIGKAS